MLTGKPFLEAANQGWHSTTRPNKTDQARHGDHTGEPNEAEEPKEVPRSALSQKGSEHDDENR